MSSTKRTPLSAREFPDYTRGEEIFNMVSHIVGAAIAIAILTLCVVRGAVNHDPWAVVSAAVYGGTMVIMFTVSAVYHGLYKNTGKQVMRIIDHCDIYFLIAGTYTPITLCAIRPVNAPLAWTVFGIEWGCAFLAVTLNAIDLKKYRVFSFICYLIMGWAIILCGKITIEGMTFPGFMWILAGGISFTIGAVLYLIGKKKRYAHSIFHIFVDIGCLLQFFGILFYCM